MCGTGGGFGVFTQVSACDSSSCDWSCDTRKTGAGVAAGWRRPRLREAITMSMAPLDPDRSPKPLHRRHRPSLRAGARHEENRAHRHRHRLGAERGQGPRGRGRDVHPPPGRPVPGGVLLQAGRLGELVARLDALRADEQDGPAEAWLKGSAAARDGRRRAAFALGTWQWPRTAPDRPLAEQVIGAKEWGLDAGSRDGCSDPGAVCPTPSTS